VHIVFRSAAGDRELDVELRSPGATLDDLLQALLGTHAPQTVAVGGRATDASCAIADSGLHEGAIVTAGGAPPSRDVARLGGAGALEAPAAPRPPDKPHFSIATTVGPLLLAIVMVLVLKDLRFAMFALLSPLIALGRACPSEWHQFPASRGLRATDAGPGLRRWLRRDLGSPT